MIGGFRTLGCGLGVEIAGEDDDATVLVVVDDAVVTRDDGPLVATNKPSFKPLYKQFTVQRDQHALLTSNLSMHYPHVSTTTDN